MKTHRDVVPAGTVGGALPAPGLRAGIVAFAAMGAVYFFSYFQRAAIPGTIFNQLQQDLALSATAVAAMGSMFTWIYGGMQIVVGILADRYGGVRTLMGGGVVMLAGSTIFPLAGSAGLLFASRALTGLGASCMYLSIVRELDRLFGPQRFTMALGVLLAMGYAGGMAATLPFEWTVSAFGWRQTLLAVAGLMALALAVAGLVLGRLGPEHDARERPSLAVFGAMLRNRPAYPLLASSLIMFPIVFVIQTVLGKKSLQDFAGLSSEAAAAFILLMASISTAAVLLGGCLPRLFANRRRPGLRAGAIMLLLSTLVLLGAALGRAPGWVYLAGYVLLALSITGVPVGTATMKELNPPGSAAASLSLMNGLAYVGCGTVGQVGGLILEHYRATAVAGAGGLVYPLRAYVALFAFLAAIATLNLVLIWLVPETNGRPAAAAAGAILDDAETPLR